MLVTDLTSVLSEYLYTQCIELFCILSQKCKTFATVLVFIKKDTIIGHVIISVFAKHIIDLVEQQVAILEQITNRGELTELVTIRRFWIVDYIFPSE